MHATCEVVEGESSNADYQQMQMNEFIGNNKVGTCLMNMYSHKE